MNCKLLAIWTSIILILWILLLYIVNMEKIRDIKEQFTAASGICQNMPGILFPAEPCNTKTNETSCNNVKNAIFNTQECQWVENTTTDTTINTTETINTNPSVLNYQIGELTKNYDSIDELDGQLETNTRKLNLLTQQTNELNRVAYVFKYITIISISLLILMICIFVLNFDHISGPSAIARSKASALFKRLKVKKPKRII